MPATENVKSKMQNDDVASVIFFLDKSVNKVLLQSLTFFPKCLCFEILLLNGLLPSLICLGPLMPN